MTIEAIMGSKRIKVSEANPCAILIQDKPGGRWRVFWDCETPESARAKVLELARNVYDQEPPTEQTP